MAGQPPKYNPQELWDKFKQYLAETEDFPSIISFCLYAELSRSSFYGYKDIEKYSDTLEKIEMKLNVNTDNQLMTARNPAGAIFYAKNKFGYSDKMDLNAKATVTTGFEDLSTEQLEAMVLDIMGKKSSN